MNKLNQFSLYRALSAPGPARTRSRWIFTAWLAGFFAAEWIATRGWFAPLANRDFSCFWVAGKLARTGGVLVAYDLEGLRAAARAWIGTTAKIGFPYPPTALLFAVPLSLLPYKLSFWLWQAFSAALFYLAAKPHLPANFPKILVLLTPAALISAIFGQVGLFYGALWLFAFSGSWIAASLLTFKPHLGLLVAVEMVRRRLVIRVVLGALALVLISVIVFGLPSWTAGLFGATSKQFGMLAGGNVGRWYTQMTTPLVSFGIWGWIVFATVALVLLFRNFNVFSAATATFLISPYGFHYDMTVVCIGFGTLLFRRADAMTVWERLVCAAAFLAPGLVSLGSWLIPPVLLVGLYVQSRYRCLEDLRTTDANSGMHTA